MAHYATRVEDRVRSVELTGRAMAGTGSVTAAN